MAIQTREIHLAKRPTGVPTIENFAFVERTLPEPAEGEVLVRNLVLSIDPYMRPRMDDVPSYVAPYEVGKALLGGAVGAVMASATASIPVGTIVTHMAGWREHAVLPADQVSPVPVGTLPISYRLGILGMPGFTAYIGLLHVAKVNPGDVVFVSGAAGAVGGLVGQFARLAGAGAVVGSVGSEDKAAYVQDVLGFDGCINYRRSEPLLAQLEQACPDGIDVYFDNVGGEHLSAALEVMRDHGRIALCGAISSYNDRDRHMMPGNMFTAVAKCLTITGFLSRGHEDLRTEFESTVGDWLASGAIHYRESTSDGLDGMPEAFIGMLGGANTGKAIVKLSD